MTGERAKEHMHGIVSLLDDRHYQLVENLWAELEREFSIRGVYVTPYPHFSYSERNFNWDITVNNIAFIHDNGTHQVLRSRFEFGK
jgi:hypothetical protein